MSNKKYAFTFKRIRKIQENGTVLVVAPNREKAESMFMEQALYTPGFLDKAVFFSKDLSRGPTTYFISEIEGKPCHIRITTDFPNLRQLD